MQSDQTELAALATLFLPFESGLLAWPQRTAFLRARHHGSLPAAGALICEQTFKPEADALRRGGFDVVRQVVPEAVPFGRVLVLPPRQRDESRALLARAVQLVGEGGRVVVAAANNSG